LFLLHQRAHPADDHDVIPGESLCQAFHRDTKVSLPKVYGQRADAGPGLRPRTVAPPGAGASSSDGRPPSGADRARPERLERADSGAGSREPRVRLGLESPEVRVAESGPESASRARAPGVGLADQMQEVTRAAGRCSRARPETSRARRG
jgi:hypothetical protein